MRTVEVFFCVVVFCFPCIIFSDNTGINKGNIPFLKWMGPGHPGTYEQYQNMRTDRPFHLKEIMTLPARSHKYLVRESGEKKILVFASSTVFPELSGKILRYVNDLNNQGYAVLFYEYHGGNHFDLKSFIKTRQQNLAGCVFIGDLPAAWYEVEDDYYEYGYAEFPCDLFYMDLDGRWLDRDGNGLFDFHEDGSGDRKPEIFIGRIDASRMAGSELELLGNYFDKNHEYWKGNIYLLQFGLTYTEDDWSIYNDMLHDISYLYSSNYESIKAPDTNRNDYLENRLKNILFEFIQLACHSSSNAHYFTRNGILYSHEISNAPPQGLAYNLFCCSALRFTDFNCLGCAYVFNPGAKSMTVVGSTKTGSMLEFQYFYRSLGMRNSVGFALKEWFEKIAPYDDYDLFWHYGMTIMGDPLVVLLSDEKDIHPPLDLSGIQMENHSLLLHEYVNVLSWNPNPLNDELGISGYRIYHIVEGDLQWLSDENENVREYFHRSIETGKRYLYGVASFRNDGSESYLALVEIFQD